MPRNRSQTKVRDGDREPLPARSLLDVTASPTKDGRSAALFPTERGVPRRRRPSDVTMLVVAGATFVLLGWLASGDPEIDARLSEFLSELPSWLRTLAWVGYTTSGFSALALVVAAGVLASGERVAVLRDLVCALGMAVILALVAGRAATGAWPYVLPEIVDVGDRLPYPTLRPALVIIVSLVLGPYVNANVQRWMRWMVLATVLSPLLLGLTTLTGIFGSLSLSMLSVAAIRLAFGSPEGLPSLDRLRATLDRAGLAVTDLAYRDDQPGTVGLATANAADGRQIHMKIYGVDAANRQRAERVWRDLWYRRAGPSPRAGRAEQAQHEALGVLSARDAGINVPAIVGAGQVRNGDVLLLSIAPSGRPLGELGEPTDTELAALWDELLALHHRARMTHGGITPDTVRLDGTTAELVDFANASLFPTEQQLGTDLVSMLASQATAVGAERAVDVAVRAVDPEGLEAALPYVQDVVLRPELRGELKSSGAKTEDLRDLIAGRLDVEPPEPAPIRRVTWRDLALAVAAIIMVNALITQIADVGLDTILEELSNASVGWLIVAFLINLAGYTTAYIGLSAVIDQPLPYLPTALLQSAKGFVGLVVPSMVGRVGLDIRFLQNAGVPLAVASTQGPILGFVGFLAEIVLLALSAWAIGQEIETDGLIDFDGGGLIAIGVLVVVIGLVVVAAVPSLRDRVVPIVREAVGTIRSTITSPRTLGQIFVSEALNRLISALALGATIAAFGASLPFPALVFVSVGTGLLAGLAPVPGGIGVAEATMSGLLTATGLPPQQSVSIAIVHRVVTAYLPPVLGFFSLNWLTEEGYL